MNKILIPTDFSEHSNYALEYATYIVREKGGELIILHITNGDDEVKNVPEQLKIVENSKYLKGINYQVMLVKGSNVSRTINSVGEDCRVDFIIMGSNGISNVEEMLLGSNTENVIRNSHINVLTIKHRMLVLKVNSILFPSDFTEESYSVFRTVKNLAIAFDSKIHLLYVETPNNYTDVASINTKMDKFMKFYRLDEKSCEKIIKHDKTEEIGIINYCIDHDIDLVSIGSHGKSVLQKLFKESTSQNLVRDSFRPILTMRFSQ